MACKRSAVRSRLPPPQSRRPGQPGLRPYKSLSSRGLGHRPFTAVTGVRIPVGTPEKTTACSNASRFCFSHVPQMSLLCSGTSKSSIGRRCFGAWILRNRFASATASESQGASPFRAGTRPRVSHAQTAGVRMSASASIWACHPPRGGCPAASPAVPGFGPLAALHGRRWIPAGWDRPADGSADRRRSRHRTGSPRAGRSHAPDTGTTLGARHSCRPSSRAAPGIPRSSSPRRRCGADRTGSRDWLPCVR